MKKTNRLVEHLEKLPHFIAVARHGSFSRAAQHLNIAQPSLSKSIKTLEDSCDTAFFSRHYSGVALTEDGKTLLKMAEDILRTAERFRLSIETKQDNYTLRSVTHELLVPLLFPEIAKHLKEVPHIGFQIYTHPSVRHLLDRIEDMKADVGIVACAPPRASISTNLLYSDSYAFYCSRDFLTSLSSKQKNINRWEELNEYPLIIAPGALAGPGQTLKEHLERKKISLKALHKVESLESVAVLTSSGLGIGILPIHIGPQLLPGNLKRFPVFDPALQNLGAHSFNFCCRKGADERTPVVKKFHRLTQLAFNSLFN